MFVFSDIIRLFFPFSYNTNKNFKRKKYLDLDLHSSHFTVAMFSVFFISSTSFHF
jgi:hypothetical protein